MSIKREDLASYIKTNYTADRIVLVGSGGVDHDALVKLAEKHFSSLPVSSNPIPLGKQTSPKTKFVGSEVRIRDDSQPAVHFALAVEGVSWQSPDFFPMLVMQAILGNWDRSTSALTTRLAGFISEHKLANSFMHFSTSYSDTGLWGVYVTSEAVDRLDDLTHFIQREWQRMSTSVSEGEVFKAVAQLKAGLLLGLDGSTPVAESIGREMVTTGRRLKPAEIEAALDSITAKDIQRVAQKYLWDQDISLAAYGRVEGLLSLDRIRADQSSMIF